MERADEVARLETLHNGKPIFESRQIEIPAAAECFEYYAGWADKVMGETIPVKGNYLTYTLREPLGVVAAIVPWNFPLLLAAWKVAPALACGNVVILKPASQTPLTAIALGEIAVEVGLPPGVLNVITGPGSSVGQAIVEHPGIDKIAFTGDTTTGKGIMKAAADTLKKITLELGGKSPNIVLPDADIDAALRDDRDLLRQGGSLRRGVAPAGRHVDQGRVHGEARGPREEDGRGRSARSEDALRRAGVEEAARDRAALRRRGEEGRGQPRRGRRARRHRHRQGLLLPADRVRQGDAGDDDRARGDFRTGARDDRVPGSRGGDRARERLAVRPRRRGLDARREEGALRRAPPAGRHRLDQHLQRLRHGRALRRLQGKRLRP